MAIDTKHLSDILRPGLAKVFRTSWAPLYDHVDGVSWKWEPGWFAAYRAALKAKGSKLRPQNPNDAMPF